MARERTQVSDIVTMNMLREKLENSMKWKMKKANENKELCRCI